MGRVFAIVNQKGGVGKTTTAVNLAACLAAEKKGTLLIDIDPQGNATSGLGVDKGTVEHSIYDALLNHLPPGNLCISTQLPCLELIPSNRQLSGAEVEMVELEQRESRLRFALEKIKDGYEFILIDCPPSLGLLTVNSLAAADAVIVPIQCEYYALEGMSQLLEVIRRVKRNLNPYLRVEGILLTMADGRVSLSGQVVDEVKRFFGDKVYGTTIPRNVRLSEAPGFGKPIILYDGFCAGAEAYRQLAKEVMNSGHVYER
ncbi:ParA family protein [bacterium]|nr:ParA family protein [bacterium]MCK4325249.1 ParA family protein [bacterium]MCK4436345.1 ParA family protein [bacterium]